MYDAPPRTSLPDAGGSLIRSRIADDARRVEEPAWYAEMIRHVRENLSRRIAVGELADIANLSVFQLSRILRREHATTPYRLVLEVRVQHAKERLKAGLTIAETAFQAGFADQSHLTRHFKRLTGMTPKAYSSRCDVR